MGAAPGVNPWGSGWRSADASTNHGQSEASLGVCDDSRPPVAGALEIAAIGPGPESDYGRLRERGRVLALAASADQATRQTLSVSASVSASAAAATAPTAPDDDSGRRRGVRSHRRIARATRLGRACAGRVRRRVPCEGEPEDCRHLLAVRCALRRTRVIRTAAVSSGAAACAAGLSMAALRSW